MSSAVEQWNKNGAPNIKHSQSPFARAAGRVWRHKLGKFGIFIIAGIIIAAVFAPFVSPHDPAHVYYEAVLQPPNSTFPFGTDEIGRCIFSRTIYGARVSLQIVFIAIVASLIAGSLIGLIAGYIGGWVDDILMRIMEGLLSFPMIVLALAIIAVLGPSLMNAMIALAIVNTPGFARLVRGQALSVKEMEYVQAARALGVSDLRIMRRHIWPSVSGNAIVYASLRGSAALITESALSFLGLGVQPPTPTWGYMVAIGMQYWYEWWMSFFPGLAIFLAVLGFNFFGDALRDAMDARLQDGR
jgi:peptide/nickel transport system permease protein